ncbi:class IV lanthionine synthetase LanL [Streptomyces sp. NPDC014748]|uniref:class IV lanthionine synthetase LanL n=1 Tax=Streptomyces sp. NPDC014748 TaxID=3364905 RepID=UPI003701FE77
MTGHLDTAGDLERLLGEALRATATVARWRSVADETWCHVTPVTGTTPEQGWKLHVSATVASAPAILTQALGVLLAEDSAFKFARSREKVSVLNSRSTPRGSSGKFLTVYPKDDAAAVRIAEELHRATAGLAGPQILSDRAYAPGSVVHYRYGAFVARRRLSDEGLLVTYIKDPDGNPVEDRRTGRYLPPSWAVCPFPTAPAVPTAPAAPAADRQSASPTPDEQAATPDEQAAAPDVQAPAPPAAAPGEPARAAGPLTLGGRFTVREAIRHTNKGGVYRGTDLRTGRPVVIKEARPHVEEDAAGRDVQDWLRDEARALERLDGLGLAPAPLALFEHGRHLFLAEEEVPGVTLRTWVSEQFRRLGADRYRADALALVGQLVDLVAAAHAQGCVLRDLTPGNVMVRPDGSLRLIDLELTVLDEESAPPTRLGTPGFSAPERLVDAPVSRTADYYSVGATACFVLVGRVPILLDDEPAAKPVEQRLASWLTACAVRLGLADGLVAMLLGLMRDEPAARWDLPRARTALRIVAATPPAHPHTPADAARAVRPPAPDGEQDPVAGIVDHLIATMTPGENGRLWPVSTTAGETAPCTVQQGAAGVLAVLTRYFELTGDPRLPEVISTAGHWITRHTDTRRARPGLHFGDRGTAWALYDAGRAVDDPRLTDHALALALAPLKNTPSHDITHGSAGSGLAALHLWNRTGDARFLELATAAAEELAAAAEPEPTGVSWAAPAEAVSRLAGKRYLGFAHGVAGIGSFLLSTALATRRSDLLDLAVDAGEHLTANAVLIGEAAHWPAQAANEPTTPYWCHGSAGIGAFLVRLYQATGDDRFGDYAHRATRAVAEYASRAPLTQCHGLAGNGDFLLDMADATRDDTHRALAEELARLLLTQRAHRHGHLVFPNEYGDVSTSWSDGSAGILAFLLRLRHASPRLWTVPPPVRADRGPTDPRVVRAPLHPVASP